jgi:hypothetical protein
MLAAAVLAASWCGAADAPKSRLPVTSPNAIVCIRVKSLSDAVDQLGKVATVFDPQLGMMAGMQLKQVAAEFPGVDLSKPVAAVVLDPKVYRDGFVGVFHVQDADAFRLGIKAKNKMVQAGLGIASDDAGAMNEVAAALQAMENAGAFGAGMTDMIVVNADIPALLARYKMEIQGGIQMLRMKLVGAGGMETELDEKQQMGVRALETLQKLVTEMEKQAGPVEIGLSLDTTRLTANVKAEAAPNTPFAAFLKQNAVTAEMVLANYLPADAYASSIMQFDPASHTNLGVGMMQIACRILGLGADETASIVAATRKTIGSMTGLQASAAVLTGKGQSGVNLYGIKDQDAGRSAMRSWVKVAQAGKVGEFLKTYGLSVALQESHRTHGGIPVDKVQVDIDVDTLAAKLPGQAGDQAEMKTAIKQMLKMSYGAEDKIVAEVVYGKRLQAMAYGADTEAVMNDQIELMKAGGATGLGKTTGYQKALASQPENASGYWHFSLFKYSDALSEQLQKAMGPMLGGMDVIPTRDELPKDEVPASGSIVHKGNASHLAIHVPIKPLADMFKVGKAKWEAMMRERMEQTPQPMPMQ